jgi:hypothetical protein
MSAGWEADIFPYLFCSMTAVYQNFSKTVPVILSAIELPSFGVAIVGA